MREEEKLLDLHDDIQDKQGLFYSFILSTIFPVKRCCMDMDTPGWKE